MRREFYYFNPRLTFKLNRIRYKPLTIVDSHKSSGKRTALDSYLRNVQGCKIWQAVERISFEEWLRNFLRLFAEEFREVNWEKELREILEAEDAAGKLGVLMKKSIVGIQMFYVLESGGYLDERIFKCIYQLAKQNIDSLHLIITTEFRGNNNYREYEMDSRVNMITISEFLLKPEEIKKSFSENGIMLSSEEVALAFQYTNGWIALVSMLFQRMNDYGKAATWLFLGELISGWGAKIKKPGDLGYSEEMQTLLTKVSMAEIFTVQEVKDILSEAEGEAFDEGAVETCLDHRCLPSLVYRDEETEVFHIHWLLNRYFKKKFLKLPPEQQEKLKRAYQKTRDAFKDVTEDLEQIQEYILQMDIDKANSEIQRLKLLGRKVRHEDRCILFVLERLKEALEGHGQNAVEILNQRLNRLFETGRFSDGWIIAIGGIIIKYFLGGDYTENMEAIEDAVLYGDLFKDRDRYGYIMLIRGLILLRKKRLKELEMIMEDFVSGTDKEKAICYLFKAMACAETDEEKAKNNMNKAVKIMVDKNYILPMASFYEYIYKISGGIRGEKEKKFFDDVKKTVNRYKNLMRMNHEKKEDAYGAKLTRRQFEAAELAGEGLGNKEIAQRMGISENTVKTTMKAVFQKLGVEKREELRYRMKEYG